MKPEYKVHYVKLGLRVAYFRNQKRLSQKMVGDRIDAEASYVSQIERGNVGMTLDKLFELSHAIGVPAYLLLDFQYTSRQASSTRSKLTMPLSMNTARQNEKAPHIDCAGIHCKHNRLSSPKNHSICAFHRDTS